MVYNSFNFLVIYPLIFLLFYLIPERYNGVRNLFLLLVSYYLYMSFSPFFVLILGGATFISYIVGRNVDNSKHKRTIITVGITLALLPLFLFKYYNFFNESFHDILLSIGIDYKQRGLNWAIPVGLSFYTLQAISYMVDVYQKKIEAEKDFAIYALYLSFFPSILMGPINRASLIIPQLKKIRPYFDYSKTVEGLKLLLWGMFMKVVVADRSGIYVDTIYDNCQIYSGPTCIIASIMYSVQIYCDFAGYSMMAMGVGKTLGFEIAENFRRPYFSASVNEFWKRWHISLSSWLKDYVYIPLGGNRIGRFNTFRNLMITFLVSGLWHGANWTFVLWGVAHACWIILERILNTLKYRETVFVKVIKIAITFLFVNFAWVLFRSADFYEASSVLSQMTAFETTAVNGPASITILVLLLVVVKDIKDEFFPNKMFLFNNRLTIVRWLSYVTLIAIILLEGVLDTGQFIYAIF